MRGRTIIEQVLLAHHTHLAAGQKANYLLMGHSAHKTLVQLAERGEPGGLYYDSMHLVECFYGMEIILDDRLEPGEFEIKEELGITYASVANT